MTYSGIWQSESVILCTMSVCCVSVDNDVEDDDGNNIEGWWILCFSGEWLAIYLLLRIILLNWWCFFLGKE